MTGMMLLFIQMSKINALVVSIFRHNALALRARALFRKIDTTRALIFDICITTTSYLVINL